MAIQLKTLKTFHWFLLRLVCVISYHCRSTYRHTYISNYQIQENLKKIVL